MFSSGSKSGSQLDKLIVKATDETLTSDNWQYILDVCDKISANPEDATKEAIKSVSARLALKDANVILRTLSLLLALAENCGSRMKQEIASKSFLNESIVKRLGDKRLHRTVKVRIVEVVKQLKDSFEYDPSLRPVADAYKQIKREYPQYVQSSQSSGPVKPAKQEITKEQRQLEEDDIQRVLKLSLQEYEREQSIKRAQLNEKPLPTPGQEQVQRQTLSTGNQNQTENSQQEGPSSGAQASSTVSKVRALYDLISYEEDELSFRKGDIINVIESVYRDWWRGSLLNGKTGIFPLNYVTPIVPKTQAQLEEERASESSLLTSDLRNVDTLLAYLSSNTNDIDEEEITRLYNSVIPLRPVLGKVIDKYAVRKEELLSLNSQLKDNVAYYNELMDNLIQMRAGSQSPQAYQRAPYPSNADTNLREPPQLQGHRYPEQLQQQPTSSGFGNAIDPGAGHQYRQSAYNNGYPQGQYIAQQPSGGARRVSGGQLLNIQSFPEVHNI